MFENDCVQMLSARSAAEIAPEALVSVTPSTTARGARVGSTGVSACNSSHRHATRPGYAPTSTTCPSNAAKTSTAPVEYVVKLAQYARVKRAALTHHDPLRDDDAIERLIAGVRQHSSPPAQERRC